MRRDAFSSGKETFPRTPVINFLSHLMTRTYEPQALQRGALDCFTPVVVYLLYLRRELPSSQIKGFSLTLNKIEAVTAGKTGGVAPGQEMRRAGCPRPYSYFSSLVVFTPHLVVSLSSCPLSQSKRQCLEPRRGRPQPLALSPRRGAAPWGD